ncbi:MAG TPA: SIMPL domain-containing protein [Fimbriimonadales bacterium]|jgi:uncharacterized protein YggE|nr:SIMPL domain-containing protein [Fimbriimonadales bacterium]
MRALIIVSAGATLLAVVAGCERAGAESVGGPSRYGVEGLRVSGTAIVRAKPDTVTFRAGKDVSGGSIKDAKRECDATMAKVMAALEAKGVPAEAIQTVDYSLFDEHLTKPSRHVWHARHIVEVRSDKVDRSADLIDAAVSAGADRVSAVSFSVAELDKLRAKAREMAVDVARRKAEQLAKLMNVNLGKAVSISDNGDFGWRGQSVYNAQAEYSGQPSAAPAESSVSGGQVVVEAVEEVVFEIR